jgi:hypothetical protein
MDFGILHGCCGNLDGRLFDFSSEENNTFGIDGGGEFVHLLADFGTLLQKCLNRISLLSQLKENHLRSCYHQHLCFQ